MRNRNTLLCQSVQQFLHSCNWDGQELEDADYPQHQLSEEFLSSWECLTVQQFLRLCGWEGEQQPVKNDLPIPTPLQHQSPQQHFTPIANPHAAWLRLSVKKFFSHCNWQGRPVEDVNWGQLDPYARMKQRVRDCFGYLPWEGNPEIGTLPKSATKLPPPLAPEPTFSDLSDLF
ncbi:MAG: hypothetical protein N4J56_000512 [Chroococcidiopsis sp. SAG 2025]|uniref:hypothetical protein n=1 Tax=Chroococcidiopsis sp. SAG 2025 TaxID=171389 RepID=UPI002936F01D|nr:hypothetical protein [Chroococcidiopsis sp. SAG 2025]MDV2990858.1 hypothetical protein [Chroococcidiopsis sp. SAG 2025]